MPCVRILPERSTDTSCQGCCARLAPSPEGLDAACQPRECIDLPLELEVSMSDALSVLWNDFGPDRTKEVGSEGNYIQCFGVGMCIDDCFVDGSECPARSAFVVLPEPRGKAVDELQPRRRFVALPGL